MTREIHGTNQIHEIYAQEPRFEIIVKMQTGFDPLLQLTGYGIELARGMKESQRALDGLSTQASTQSAN